MHDIHESETGEIPYSKQRLKLPGRGLLGHLKLHLEQLACADALAVDVENDRQRTES